MAIEITSEVRNSCSAAAQRIIMGIQKKNKKNIFFSRDSLGASWKNHQFAASDTFSPCEHFNFSAMNELRSPVERPCQPNGCRGTRVTELRIKAAVFFCIKIEMPKKGVDTGFLRPWTKLLNLSKFDSKINDKLNIGYSNFVHKALEDGGQGKSESICIDCVWLQLPQTAAFWITCLRCGAPGQRLQGTNSSTNSSAWWHNAEQNSMSLAAVSLSWSRHVQYIELRAYFDPVHIHLLAEWGFLSVSSEMNKIPWGNLFKDLLRTRW